jgi:hypothetical protein
MSASSLFDLNGARFVALGTRNKQCQDPVAILGLDAVGVDADGKGYRTVEGARYPFAPM